MGLPNPNSLDGSSLGGFWEGQEPRQDWQRQANFLQGQLSYIPNTKGSYNRTAMYTRSMLRGSLEVTDMSTNKDLDLADRPARWLGAYEDMLLPFENTIHGADWYHNEDSTFKSRTTFKMDQILPGEEYKAKWWEKPPVSLNPFTIPGNLAERRRLSQKERNQDKHLLSKLDKIGQDDFDITWLLTDQEKEDGTRITLHEALKRLHKNFDNSDIAKKLVPEPMGLKEHEPGSKRHKEILAEHQANKDRMKEIVRDRMRRTSYQSFPAFMHNIQNGKLVNAPLTSEQQKDRKVIMQAVAGNIRMLQNLIGGDYIEDFAGIDLGKLNMEKVFKDDKPTSYHSAFKILLACNDKELQERFGDALVGMDVKELRARLETMKAENINKNKRVKQAPSIFDTVGQKMYEWANSLNASRNAETAMEQLVLGMFISGPLSLLTDMVKKGTLKVLEKMDGPEAARNFSMREHWNTPVDPDIVEDTMDRFFHGRRLDGSNLEYMLEKSTGSQQYNYEIPGRGDIAQASMRWNAKNPEPGGGGDGGDNTNQHRSDEPQAAPQNDLSAKSGRIGETNDDRVVIDKTAEIKQAWWNEPGRPKTTEQIAEEYYEKYKHLDPKAPEKTGNPAIDDRRRMQHYEEQNKLAQTRQQQEKELTGAKSSGNPLIDAQKVAEKRREWDKEDSKLGIPRPKLTGDMKKDAKILALYVENMEELAVRTGQTLKARKGEKGQDRTTVLSNALRNTERKERN